MANRRMFSRTIIDTDIFLDMPLSTQALYFHLAMRADDEGFLANVKKIMRMVGSCEDDYKILMAKKFLIEFETGVCVITHWRIHNYIQSDRKTNTIYTFEKSRLCLDNNKAYQEITENMPSIPENKPKKLSPARQKRQKARKESELPSSFDYKIRNAFLGKVCPVCGRTMQPNEFDKTDTMPTIQHNIPISKGGKHEIDNISVICRSCNSSLQAEICPPYNTDEVKEVWENIGNVGGMDTQVRLELGKDSLEIDKVNKENIKRKNFKKPTIEEIKSYCKERNNNIDANQFYDFYEARGWKIGKNSMKDWKASVRTWERNNFNKPQQSKIYGKGKEQQFVDSIGEW